MWRSFEVVAERKNTHRRRPSAGIEARRNVARRARPVSGWHLRKMPASYLRKPVEQTHVKALDAMRPICTAMPRSVLTSIARAGRCG